MTNRMDRIRNPFTHTIFEAHRISFTAASLTSRQKRAIVTVECFFKQRFHQATVHFALVRAVNYMFETECFGMLTTKADYLINDPTK